VNTYSVVQALQVTIGGRIARLRGARYPDRAMNDQPSDFRPKARRPRGFQDRRGATLKREREIVERVLGVYEAWGFERLETSAFEYADALGKFLPDQDRPNEGVFAVADDDEQWMALRYDLTAPLARFVAENYDALPKPYRRCAAGPVWRNEKPGPGRFREFWQCDADTVGAASPAADAEMIAVACAALEAAGVEKGGYRINLNTRRLLNGVLDAAGAAAAQRLTVLRAVDKLDRLGVDGVAALLGAGRKDESGDFTKGAGLAPAAIDRVLAFVQAGRETRAATLDALAPLVGEGEGAIGLAELAAASEALAALGVSDADARIEPSIVRGLEYYTGAVFEAELLRQVKDEDGNLVRFGSVGGGGRYDDLVSRFKGVPIPATGFSIGVSRLAAALTLSEKGEEAAGPVVVLAMDQADMGEYLAMAQELRKAAIPAEVYLGGAGMKAQMKYADKRAAPIAIIRGGDEKAKGVVTLKNLKRGAELAPLAESDREAWKAMQSEIQREAPREGLVAAVRAMLERED
jgi:histidyl-tRNA synthetase